MKTTKIKRYYANKLIKNAGSEIAIYFRIVSDKKGYRRIIDLNLNSKQKLISALEKKGFEFAKDASNQDYNILIYAKKQ